MRSLTDKQRADWLQLIRTESIGPITFHRLIAKFGAADVALARLPETANARRKSPIRIASRTRVEEEIARAAEAGARFIASCEAAYPRKLAAIPDPPPVICIRGHASLFERSAVAIVGARNASAAGRRFARTLAA
ncbi:MAG: DNA-processing protein DprA, partial [Pseudomonadota bacterium]